MATIPHTELGPFYRRAQSHGIGRRQIDFVLSGLDDRQKLAVLQSRFGRVPSPTLLDPRKK